MGPIGFSGREWIIFVVLLLALGAGLMKGCEFACDHSPWRVRIEKK